MGAILFRGDGAGGVLQWRRFCAQRFHGDTHVSLRQAIIGTEGAGGTKGTGGYRKLTENRPKVKVFNQKLRGKITLDQAGDCIGERRGIGELFMWWELCGK
jgi:hypothetical protein